jgi:hypothetical protein
MNTDRSITKINPILIAAGLLVLAVTYFAPLKTARSDPAMSLLVSQLILEHQTTALDVYRDAVDERFAFEHNYRVEQKNGHYYYLFPLAPSVFALPAVWLANRLGLNMLIPEEEYLLQGILSPLTCVAIFFILYQICRGYLDSRPALVIALIFTLGSSLVSTLGTALWNMNVAVLFVCLSLLLVARRDTDHTRRINPLLLGFFLFAAFWSRPTVTPFIVVVFGYVLLRHRPLFMPLAATAGGFLLLFVAWSWLTYGQMLPDYYAPGRLSSPQTFWEALYGNSFSPGRGIFVFSPFLAWVLVGALWFWRDLKKYDLFWFSLIWFGLHLLSISRKYPDWWGGHQFGPRLLTDGLPALLLVSALLWREVAARGGRRTQGVALAGYLLLGTAGIFINSYQGLYNLYTDQWNKNPDIDRNPHYIFEWRYPQFLADAASIQRRRFEYEQGRLGTYALGDPLTPTDSRLLFWGWRVPEKAGWRWTETPDPRLLFKLEAGVVDPAQTYALELVAGSAKGQPLRVSLNQAEMGGATLEAFRGTMPAPIRLTFPGRLLADGAINTLEFTLPDAPGETDGIALVSLKIYPFTGEEREGVNYFESEFFRAGFSHVEQGWRWTDGLTATLVYPLEAVDPQQPYTLELLAGALDTQEVQVMVNGTPAGSMTFAGFEPQTRQVTLGGATLKAQSLNSIELRLPQAAIPPGDSRRLGLAFVAARIYPAEGE